MSRDFSASGKKLELLLRSLRSTVSDAISGLKFELTHSRRECHHNTFLNPIVLQNGLEHMFHSLEDSLDFLEHEWPTRFGTHHKRASDLCRAAAARMVSKDAAYEAFISASLETGMALVFSTAAFTSQDSPSVEIKAERYCVRWARA